MDVDTQRVLQDLLYSAWSQSHRTPVHEKAMAELLERALGLLPEQAGGVSDLSLTAGDVVE